MGGAGLLGGGGCRTTCHQQAGHGSKHGGCCCTCNAGAGQDAGTWGTPTTRHLHKRAHTPRIYSLYTYLGSMCLPLHTPAPTPHPSYDLLVGADGANSAVRGLLQGAVPSFAFTQQTAPLVYKRFRRQPCPVNLAGGCWGVGRDDPLFFFLGGGGGILFC